MILFMHKPKIRHINRLQGPVLDQPRQALLHSGLSQLLPKAEVFLHPLEPCHFMHMLVPIHNMLSVLQHLQSAMLRFEVMVHTLEPWQFWHTCQGLSRTCSARANAHSFSAAQMAPGKRLRLLPLILKGTCNSRLEQAISNYG